MAVLALTMLKIFNPSKKGEDTRKVLKHTFDGEKHWVVYENGDIEEATNTTEGKK